MTYDVHLGLPRIGKLIVRLEADSQDAAIEEAKKRVREELGPVVADAVTSAAASERFTE